MARSRGRLRYLTGTASQLGVSTPSYQGSTSSGGLLVLLVGAYLFLAFTTGRLNWLTSTIGDAFAAHDAYVPPAAVPSSSPPGSAPGASPAWSSAYRQTPRPRTAYPGQAYA